MIELISVPALLAGPRFVGGSWCLTRTWWTRADVVALKALCEADAPLEKSADALGREPSSIAHRARDTKLHLPREWRDAITIKKPRLIKLREPGLQYPYIRNVRGEHADLLMVNSLVPRGLPSHIRADVCQEIMLALWQKETSLEELRAERGLLNKFIRSARVSNFEAGGYALSLDQPMQDGRSWYDVLPDDQEKYATADDE